METTLYKSKFGHLKITSMDQFLVSIDMNPVEPFNNLDSEFNNFVIFQLEEYFQGERTSFDVPLKLLSSSEFNIKVWNEILKVPYGKSTSYKAISERIGHKSAYRAVGTAVGKNPIPFIVPCHRVINANGSLGGFSLGLDIKKELIKIEQMDGLKKNY